MSYGVEALFHTIPWHEFRVLTLIIKCWWLYIVNKAARFVLWTTKQQSPAASAHIPLFYLYYAVGLHGPEYFRRSLTAKYIGRILYFLLHSTDVGIIIWVSGWLQSQCSHSLMTMNVTCSNASVYFCFYTSVSKWHCSYATVVNPTLDPDVHLSADVTLHQIWLALLIDLFFVVIIPDSTSSLSSSGQTEHNSLLQRLQKPLLLYIYQLDPT